MQEVEAVENLCCGWREHSGDREIAGIKPYSYQLGTVREQGACPLAEPGVIFRLLRSEMAISPALRSHCVQLPAACLFLGLETDDSYGLT